MARKHQMNRVKVGNCFSKIWLYAGKSGVSDDTHLSCSSSFL